MAEGGGEEDPSNPFSFKTYVKKKTRQPEEQDVDTDDIFAITGAASSTRKKEKQSLVVAEDDDDSSNSKSTKTKKKSSKENPFSFKKFIGQSGSNAKESQPAQRRPVAPDVRQNGSMHAGLSSPSSSPSAAASSSPAPSVGQPVVAAPPDFASHLPDFIQNHFSEDGSRQEHDRRQLPDFALQGQLAHDSARERDLKSGSLFAASKEDNVLDNTFSDEEEDGAHRGRQLSLPDFLVDSAMPGAQGGGESDTDHVSGHAQGAPSRSRLPELPPLGDAAAESKSASDRAGASDSGLTLRQVQEENRHLKATLAQMRQRASDEDARIAGLEKEISRLRKKEAEETAVMERAVQQVEENLVATTTRAVQAETVAGKLKQEVKSLQSQVKALTAENLTLQSGDKGLADLRERTKYSSQQLAAAAVTAETNLKELLSGVEKLKLLGQVLGSLEKVTDADSLPTHDDAPKASTV